MYIWPNCSDTDLYINIEIIFERLNFKSSLNRVPYIIMQTRGVQIRSEQKYTYRIGLIKLFRSRIGSDFDVRNKMN